MWQTFMTLNFHIRSIENVNIQLFVYFVSEKKNIPSYFLLFIAKLFLVFEFIEFPNNK
jgi:hypothetical protein